MADTTEAPPCDEPDAGCRMPDAGCRMPRSVRNSATDLSSLAAINEHS